MRSGRLGTGIGPQSPACRLREFRRQIEGAMDEVTERSTVGIQSAVLLMAADDKKTRCWHGKGA